MPTSNPRQRLAESLVELQRLSSRLRRDCPWDREQTTLTIVPHTVEEAYEVADAATSGDPRKLVDELGDLLFQVVFLALLLEEQGDGDLEAVARSVHEKLVRRHPHVFGDADASTPARVKERWEADQVGAGGEGRHLPRPPRVAAGAPPRAEGAAARCRCGLRLARSATARSTSSSRRYASSRARSPARARPRPRSQPDPRVVDEMGDVLFAAVNAARRLERRSRAGAAHARRDGSSRASRRPSASRHIAARSGRTVARGAGA